jgi:hypothetical protein
MEKSAIISECGKYRYELIRDWSDEEDCFPGGQITFIMLNPSTADAEADDPTIRKCIGFAKFNGYNRLKVVNLFAWRATDPKELKSLGREERVGPKNNDYLPKDGEDVVAAWGAGFPYNHDFGRSRIFYTTECLKSINLMCVRKTEQRPWHPLYVPYGEFQSLKEKQ